MNEILLLIRAVHLDPLEFGWTDREQDEYIEGEGVRFRVSVLTHGPTGNVCTFGGFRMIFSPGHEMREEIREHGNSWEKKKDIARYWLNELEEEAKAPDFWAAIRQETALPIAASSASMDNRPFTPTEQNLIAATLDEIKAYLIEGERFDAQEAETVEREFAYLKQSTERLGRKDWLNALLGGLIALAVTLALDPEKAKGLLRLAGAAFQSLWGVAQAYLQ